MPVIKKSIFINAPFEKIFNFVKNPKDWDCWYAGLIEPDSINGKGEVGTIAKTRFLYMGRLVPVTVEVKEETLGNDSGVWKGNIEGTLGIEGGLWKGNTGTIMEGPITTQEKFTFLPKENGTEVTFEIDQSVPAEGINSYLFLKSRENQLAQALENLKVFSEYHYGPKM